MPLPKVYIGLLSFLACCLAGLAGAEPLAADLGQLSLQTAQRLLLENNHEILSAQHAAEGARADIVSAAARPNPVLSVSTNGIRRHVGGGNPWDRPYDTTVHVDQLIERGDKRELRVATAAQASQAAEYDVADAMRQQRIAVSNAYYDLRLAQEKRAILSASGETYEHGLRAAHLRLKAGDIASADVMRLQVDAARAANDLRQAQADWQKAQLALAYLLGVPGRAAEIKAVDDWPGVESPPDADSTARILAQRPDLRAAQARVAAATQARDLARAQRARDVTVGLQYEHQPPDASNSAGISISVPLFINNDFRGEIARAESNLTAAEEDLDRVRDQAQIELTRTRADLDAAAERLARMAQGMLSDGQRAAQAAELAYQHGASGVMDLLDARRTLRALEVEAATSHADYAKALSAWVEARRHE